MAVRALVPSPWQTPLAEALARPEIAELEAFLAARAAAGAVLYPPAEARFAALALTPPQAVRVVILGQDPYHGPGQAMGLAFSVPPGVKPPPSLKNIYRELESDCGVRAPLHGDLSGWARQGVLLLNSALTVEAGQAGSHARRGWEVLTGAVVEAAARSPEPSVFMLWGAHAQAHRDRIAALGEGRHCIIESVHPSPLSAYRGFFGSKPFSRANAFLAAHGRGTVDWGAGLAGEPTLFER